MKKEYNEKEIIEFANYVLDNIEVNKDGVNDASLANWKGLKEKTDTKTGFAHFVETELHNLLNSKVTSLEEFSLKSYLDSEGGTFNEYQLKFYTSNQNK